MRDFKELLVWQRSHALTLAIYKVSKSFPRAEQYGLTSQLRRSSSSIPSNIAEGSAAKGEVEFSRYLRIARRSASELEYQLILASDLGYLDQSTFDNLVDEVRQVQKMLGAFISKLAKDIE